MARRSTYNQDLDEHWNPMKEAYQDPHFNTYRDGPGANLGIDKQPCSVGSSQRKDKEFRLYVGNVPADIDQDGIRNVFQTAGNPNYVFRAKKPATWAIVTFNSLREAEEARRQLHRVPPMNFIVQYAKGSEPENEYVVKRPIDDSDLPPEPERSLPTRKLVQNNIGPSGKGRGLAVAPCVDLRTPGPGVDFQEKTNIRQFQQYGGSNYDESNMAMMRGVQRANGPGGPRKFVMGRGCFDREMDQLCQPQNLGKVVDDVHGAKVSIENYMQRKNDTYEYSKKEYPPGFTEGTCTYCSAPSTQYCAQCKDWYCSRLCQEKDWLRHKSYCGISAGRKSQFEDSSSHGNSDQKFSSPPRKDRFEGKGGYHSKRDTRDISSKQMPPASYKQKEKQFDQKSKYSDTGLEENHCSDELNPQELSRNEKVKSPQNKNFSQSQGKESRFAKRGFQNISQNGNNCTSFLEKEQKPSGLSNGDKAEKFQKGKWQPRDNSYVEKHPNKPKQTIPRESFNNEKRAASANIKDASRDRNGNDGAKGFFEKEPKLASNAKGLLNEDNKDKFQKGKGPRHELPNGDRDPSVKPKQTTSPKGSSYGNVLKSANNVNNASKGIPLKSQMGCEERQELSNASFTKVTVQVALGPDEYWVQLSSKCKDVYSMSTEMGLQKDSASVKLSVGNYCMAKYENFWFRAKITSSQPKVMVFFIDFGNEETANPEELKVLPDTFKDMKSQAIRIKLAPETSQKYQRLDFGAELSVKCVHEDREGIATVHVEGEVYTLSSVGDEVCEVEEEETPIALQNITVLLQTRMSCSLTVTEYDNDKEFLASLVPTDMKSIYNDLFSDNFQEECRNIRLINFMPQIGEAVIAKFAEGWLRAYVLQVSTKKEFTVASCDLGIVEVVKEVKKMPRRCREIPQFAVHCGALDKIRNEFLTEFRGNILIEHATSDTAVAEVENEYGEKECKIEISKWNAPYELFEELKCVELKDGDCVISAEMSPFELYVRPLTSSCVEIYNRLLQEVAKHCLTPSILNYTPKVGQVLAAKYAEDGNFYRAVVREVNQPKGVKVQYMDFGNVEYVSKDMLVSLPKSLRDVVCCVVKVVLEDVVDQPLNEGIQNMFKELILESAHLKVKLCEPQSNRVRLYMKDGTNLNEKINKMLIPGWKKGEVDKYIYTVQNVRVEELESDSLLELVILAIVGQTAVVVRPQSSKLINILKNDLQPRIDEYCEKTSEPYTPREMELCLALVDKLWCRCLCINGGNPLSLYCLDDGRVRDVAHEYIRKYLQEFTCLPAVGVRCEIQTTVDIRSKNPTQQKILQEKIRVYLTRMKLITAKVIKSSPSKSGLHGYTIAVPELDDFLQTLL